MHSIENNIIRRITSALEGLDSFIFFETSRLSGENHRSYLLLEPLCWLEYVGGNDVSEFLCQVETYQNRGYFLGGWFAYEFGRLLEPAFQDGLQGAGRTLARLGVFEKPVVFDHQTGEFSQGQGWPVATGESATCTVDKLQTNISEQEFLHGVDAIKKYIKSGDTYQVNYTFKLDFSFAGSPAALYLQLRRNQSVSYGAWMRYQGQDIMSFSPELFFAADEQGIRVRPMKGTLTRGKTLVEDTLQARTLCTDAKSRSENVMIVDLLRNDLARLLYETGGGQVRAESLFDVEPYESLLQMTSTIKGVPVHSQRIRLSKIFKSLFPCGSVTGAPKIRTMEIIEELEKEPRGVYCGAIGWLNRDEMCFNVPIRTLTLDGEKGSMGIGAGIVFDSDPKSEWRECLLKGRFLTHRQPEFQLIETLFRQPEGGFFLLSEHLDRLRDSAAYFFFQLDLAEVRNRLNQEEATFADKPMRVRLLLNKDGRVEITSTPLLETAMEDALPRVAFSSHIVDPEDPFLYHKTTLRDLYNRKREEAAERGLYEILFVNTRDEVTEGTISTLFVEMDGQMYTPPISCGLLPGTFRHSYLASGKAREQVLSIEDVVNADALYVANSVRGLVRVEL